LKIDVIREPIGFAGRSFTERIRSAPRAVWHASPGLAHETKRTAAPWACFRRAAAPC